MSVPELSPPVAGQQEQKLRILFVGTQMALGGAQRLLLDQARWFHAHGHPVTAAFFYDKQGLAATWRQNVSFPLMTFARFASDGGSVGRLMGLAAGMLRLWRLLRAGHFDVVVTFTYDSNLLALPLAWLAGVPARIATHHGIIEGFSRLVERMHSWLVNAGIASILVNVSRKVLEQAASAGIRREHMTVIQNGIAPMPAHDKMGDSVRAELGLAEADILLLAVGRLVYQKGHEFLVQAMGQLAIDLPHIRAIICGEGPLREQLESQIERLAPGGRVRLLGNRLDIGRFLGAADIFVLPSRWEGLPVALLEAMDASVPVVATRVEGVEEVVQDQVNGLLVPPEDARALARSLETLVVDASLRDRIGRAGRERVLQAYTTDIMCEKYLALMLTLQQNRRRRKGR